MQGTYASTVYCFQFRFADSTDYVLMFVGFVFACLQGTTVQMNFVILKNVLDIFVETTSAMGNK